MGVKEFFSMLRSGSRSDDDLEFFNYSNIQSTRKGYHSPLSNGEAIQLWNEFADVFCGVLPDELPPKRDDNHGFEVLPNSKPSYCRLFQLSPAELIATMEYVFLD